MAKTMDKPDAAVPTIKKRPRSLLDPNTGRVKPGAIKKTRKVPLDDLPPAPAKKTGPRPKPIKFNRKAKKLREAEKKKAADAEDLRLHDIRTRILELRRYASIRQISEHLKEEGFTGASPASVHKHLCAALDEMRNELTLDTERYVAFELEKLEHKENAVAPNLIRMAERDRQLLRDAGEIKYADAIEKYDRVLDRLSKRRDQLLGVLKPTKVEHSGPDGGPIETSSVTRVILPTIADSDQSEK